MTTNVLYRQRLIQENINAYIYAGTQQQHGAQHNKK